MDRNNLKQSLKVMMKVQNDLENSNRSWIIYPEGTRNIDNFAILNNFHSGTFRVAIKAQKDIIPIAIYGTQRVLKISKYKKLPVHISILPPIKYEDAKDMNTDQLSTYVQNLIQREISFRLRKKDHSYMLKHNKKNYRFNKID